MQALDFDGTVKAVQKQVFDDIMSGVRFSRVCEFLVQSARIYARDNALALKSSDAPKLDINERGDLFRIAFEKMVNDVQTHMLNNMMGSREDGKQTQPLGEVVQECVQLVVDRYIEFANKGLI